MLDHKCEPMPSTGSQDAIGLDLGFMPQQGLLILNTWMPVCAR
jgi:hypothetical protein